MDLETTIDLALTGAVSFTAGSSAAVASVLVTRWLIGLLKGFLQEIAQGNGLPEEYQAHLLDQCSEMIEAGEPAHVIRFKLLWYWFVAAVWTPSVSKLQNLIPPNRISS
jgi:hypothetical protein